MRKGVFRDPASELWQRRRTPVIVWIALLGCFWPAAAFGRPVPEAAESRRLHRSSFRLSFGLKDRVPRQWDGRLVVSDPAGLRVDPERFRVNDYGGAGTRSEKTSRVPNDALTGRLSWVCRTREVTSGAEIDEYHVGVDQPTGSFHHPSILVHCLDGPAQPIGVQTANGSFTFHPDRTELFAPQFFLGGSVRVDRLPPAMPVADHLAQQDFPSVLARGDGLWMAWQEFDGESDAIYVRQKVGDNWKPAEKLADKLDAFRPRLAEDKLGRLWVVWSAQVAHNWDLYGRFRAAGEWSSIQRITSDRAPDLFHALVTDSAGTLWLVWQKTSEGSSQIMASSFDGQAWSEEERISVGASGEANNWWPVIAAGPDGQVAVAWDGYASENYDVYLRNLTNGCWGSVIAVADTPRFEAHPSIAIDRNGRIWLAWDESGARWGKDTGFLVENWATTLHESRSIRVGCVEADGKRTAPPGLEAVLPRGECWELPHLQLDRHGTPWLFARQKVQHTPSVSPRAPEYRFLWEVCATKYDSAGWASPVRLPHSTGRNDMMPSTTRDRDGNIWIAWSTDGRSVRSWMPSRLQVYVAALAGKKSEPVSVATLAERATPSSSVDAEEVRDVARIRGHRVLHRGKSYSVFRGDLHRHTDFSLDGGNDGSLLDAYRYARDAAALDFVAVTDHTHGIEDPYSWWLNQKYADFFQSPGHFAALYGYERSVEYPAGHRNILFAERGHSIWPVSSGEVNGWQGPDALFWYLRRAGGFSIPHTTGRTSGTDWRQTDSDVETLVEIFQGMRDTYEYPGAPRPGRGDSFPDSSKPVPRASSSQNSPSFRPLGFVWEALGQGHRLGFIASSDHISTHFSYAFLIAEKLTPAGLLDAVRSRRAYAATDNILLDVRFLGSDGEHLMGEEFHSSSPVLIRATIAGTDEIARVDLFKDGELLATRRPDTRSVDFEFVEKQVEPKTCWYYLRVIQRDREMAWSSPVWVRY